MTRGAVVLALALLFAGTASAHKNHEPSPSPSPESAAEDAAESSEPAAPAGEGPVDALPADDPEPGAFDVIPWRDALTGHLHNKVVHFPLAFGLAAGVMLLVAPRWPAYEPAARVLLVIAALLAVVAYFSGQAQEGAFEDSPFHSVVELHETFGTVSGLTLAAGVALSFWSAARRFMPVYGLLLIGVLACTGFLGGVLSHS